MPSFSRSLEQSLHRALALANERHHEYATLEHLLLALLDDSDAAAVMRACNVDLDKLRRALTALRRHVADSRDVASHLPPAPRSQAPKLTAAKVSRLEWLQDICASATGRGLVCSILSIEDGDLAGLLQGRVTLPASAWRRLMTAAQPKE